MRLRDYAHCKVSVGTLLTLVCCGLAGMVVDLDHLWGGRAAHTPVLVFGLCLGGACIARLLWRVVLKRKG